MASILAMVALFASCTVHQSKMAKDTLEEMRPYCPYTENQTVTFVNDHSRERISYVVSLKEHTEVYPYFSTNTGDWEASVAVYFTKLIGDSLTKEQCRFACGVWCSTSPFIVWSSSVVADTIYNCYVEELLRREEDVFQYFSDTVVLTDEHKLAMAVPKGKPYIRVIKHKGLTDFSVDGQTTWRVVEE